MREGKLDRFDELTLLQAIVNVCGDEVSTKNAGSLRSVCDREIIDAYEETGAKSYDRVMNGVKVGTYSVRVSKPKEETVLVIDDEDAFSDWCLRNGCWVPDKAAAWEHLNTNGELPDGSHVESTEIPARVLGTTLKVDPVLVAQAFGSELPSKVAGLLGGAV